ncbi:MULTISPECIES: transporter substrate-binding domain-containing protein [unclassified Duganella]|uniref:transporter substrate-binding domain-containing protein n=1 Tax=unclassified Duganella TaxID=2636909 RepID=UPI001314E277|nr:MULTISPECIES: transporter substrate-binding domain-containing protein [unclassified Duganella]
MTKTKTWGLLAGLALLLHGRLAPAAESVPLYVYYSDPTFAAGAPGSLTDKMAAWLTQRSNGRYQFVATQLPRRRLELMMEQPHWPGVVAWANPRWFAAAGARQGWSRYYMVDANLVASLRSAPLEYVDDSSLYGQNIGTVQGYTYKNLEPLVKDGKLVRDDADTELRNLLKLQQHRVPVAFLQASSLPRFHRQFADLDRWLYLSARPRTVFERAFFTAPNQPELLDFLNRQADALLADQPWQDAFGTCKLVLPRQSGATDAQRKLCR